MALPPAASISALTAFASSSPLWKLIVTAAPWRASSSAMARPMPLALPVTIATLFSSDILVLLV